MCTRRGCRDSCRLAWSSERVEGIREAWSHAQSCYGFPCEASALVLELPFCRARTTSWQLYGMDAASRTTRHGSFPPWHARTEWTPLAAGTTRRPETIQALGACKWPARTPTLDSSENL